MAGLAVYDQFRGQIAEEVLRRFEEANITVILVQGGWTSHLRPLDLTVMANFKEAPSFLWRVADRADAQAGGKVEKIKSKS